MNTLTQMESYRTHSLRRYSGQVQPLARLVCFTWCGAGASVYRRLASSLSSSIELYAVQLPGREDRFSESKIVRMEQLVAHVLPELLALEDDLPLILFGHSMGALLAYEMALSLQAIEAKACKLLIVSGHGAPDAGEHQRVLWHTKNEDEFVANIAQLGGTPPALLADRAMMRMLIPVLRADYEVLETYHYQRPNETEQKLHCPVIACAGELDKEVNHASLHGWKNFTHQQFDCHWFSGDHFYLNAQPRALTRCLEQWILRDLLHNSQLKLG